MPTLTITRGLPGCGKTTHALAWVAQYPTRRARVNRDDTRAMLHGARLGTADQEKLVSRVTHGAIRDLLAAGTDVIVDDTNLVRRHARDLRRIAQLAGAGFEVLDMTNVPPDVCIERDRQRAQPVGEAVIREMWERYVRGFAYPLPLPDDPADATTAVVPYVPRAGTPTAVMVDVDGTVALMCGRSPYDESRVHEDRPNAAVIAAVRAMHAAGHEVVFCSGRTEACRTATEKWLVDHVQVPYAGLFMRPAGDVRKDAVVKAELFDRYIRDRWTVVCVFDDRAQVVAAWRGLGLTVFQVAEGNF